MSFTKSIGCILLTLAVAAAGCGSREVVPLPDPLDHVEEKVEEKVEIAKRNPLEIQALVMGMADEYAAALGEAVYLVLRSETATSTGRWLAQSFMRNGVGAAIDIGAGSNPNVALLDLMVLGSLQSWAFETHWLGAGIGEEVGAAALARIRKGEDDLWAAGARYLSPEHLESMRSLVLEWIEENPDRTVVSLVRFQDFNDLRRLPALATQGDASGILADLEEATDALEKTQLLGERLIWYLGRYPYVLGEQVELTTYRIADQPEAKLVLDSLEALKGTVGAISRRVETLDEDLFGQQRRLFEHIAAERANALDDLSKHLRDERELALEDFYGKLAIERHAILDEIEERQAAMRPMMADMHRIISDSTSLAKELTRTLEALDIVVRRFDRDPDDDREPLDIDALTAAAAETSTAAVNVTTLLDKLVAMLGSDKLDRGVDSVSSSMTSVVDRAFWRAIWLIGAVFAGILVLRIVPRRMVSDIRRA